METIIIIAGIIVILDGILHLYKTISNFFSKDKPVKVSKIEKNKQYRAEGYGKTIILNGKKYKSVRSAAEDLGIPVTTLVHWCESMNIDDINYKIRHYKPTIKTPFTINGYVFTSTTDAATKLGVNPSTLGNWRADKCVEKKLRELGIDIEEVAKKFKLRKRIEEPKVEVKESNKKKKRNFKIKISPTIPPKYLIKYGLKVGDEFDSCKEMSEYLGVSGSLPTDWLKRKYIERA